MGDSPKTVVFCAPQAWGKTRDAETLRQEFGCTTVVDEWYPSKPLTQGALHLTNSHPEEVERRYPQLLVFSRGW